ncbi:hypothetical protein AAC387_Pa01g1247 [Persea americana]
MSSLAERLRNRAERKPLYNDNESDEDLDLVHGGFRSAETKPERITRADAKNDACQACGESENLLCCETCNYAYHAKCLLPPLKVAPRDDWRCPECVSPLNDIDKILDCEMRPTGVDENEASKLGSNQKYVKQYLVKWKGLSYLHCTWVPEKEFLKAYRANPRLRTKVRNFHRQMDAISNSEDDWVAIRPEWTTVDRIIAIRKTDGEREYLVKWKELPYDECYWELGSDISAFLSQIERFNQIQSRAHKSSVKKKSFDCDVKESKTKQKEFQQYEHSPGFLSGGTLHPYQLEGLNFLRFAWSKHTHVILADEMGLGKTIQSIAFLASHFEENLSPHLVVAPLSTLRNWEREFATWAPQMNVVLYVGSAQARAVIREYEFYYPLIKSKKHKKKKIFPAKESKQKRIKFDVLLTSYEMINMDTSSLKSMKWQCMIVDEGHRLKNKDSKLFMSLKDFSTKHRVLLTGTPLQNNLDELFMLMHFLDAGKFSSLEEFQQEFKDISQEEQIARLHKMLAPHLLRRVKKDVMKDLPPKKELILRVELSSLQKEYYKAILTRNYQILARRGGPQISLINVVMELRKLCCHAYMLEGVEPEIEDAKEAYRHLLDSSGKLHLLDKLMVKLKEQGHRVLIYTQFQHMLDLLEDYLSYKKWNYERVDGKVSGVERQIRIDRFNAKNSTRFCFLLSTRAGGLGINLATADTVIIYDSDWNPHADLQAMARAHRLGQTNKVMIYRLITRGTIEERMMQLTKKKMILEHLVVGRLKAQTINQEELDDIIRYGSKELFADDSDEAGKARQIHYDDAAIDRLLDRDQIENEEASLDDEEDDSFLKAFKVANFEYIDNVDDHAAAVEEAKRQSIANKDNATNSERTSYWEDLLKERYEVHQSEEFAALGKRKRSRKQIASTEEDDLAGLEDVSSDDEEDNNEAEWIDSEMISSGNVSGRKGSKKKSRDALPLMEGEGKSFKVLGFNQNQRATFVQILMRYGLGDCDWRDFIPRLKQKTSEEIHEYGHLFLTHIAEEITDSPSFLDGVPKEGLRIPDVLVRIAVLHLIREKVQLHSEKPGTPLFAEDILSRLPALRSGRVWKEQHDLSLLRAVLKHGYARWQAILEDRDLGFQDIIRQEQNLPSINSPVVGSVQMHDVPISPYVDSKHAHESQLRGPAGASDSSSVPDVVAQGATEVARGNNTYQDPSMLYHFREVQRRMVEFIKKRVLLLEKAINAECHKEFYKEMNINVHTTKPESEPMAVDVPGPVSLEPNMQSSALLPSLDPIAMEEVSAAACDDKSDRVELAQLYNEMCKFIDDNINDTGKASIGSKSDLLPLEAIYENMNQVLAVRQQISNDVMDVDIASGSGGHDSRPGPEAETFLKDPNVGLAKEIPEAPQKLTNSPNGALDVEMEAATGDAKVAQNVGAELLSPSVIILDD